MSLTVRRTSGDRLSIVAFMARASIGVAAAGSGGTIPPVPPPTTPSLTIYSAPLTIYGQDLTIYGA